jgi:hypothetical protein
MVLVRIELTMLLTKQQIYSLPTGPPVSTPKYNLEIVDAKFENSELGGTTAQILSRVTFPEGIEPSTTRLEGESSFHLS